MNTSEIDLNLLRVLVVLYSEKQVTRASKILGLSQPALSHALRRLRRDFKDDLFVRSRVGLVPTPRCIAMIPAVQKLLAEAEGIYRVKDNMDTLSHVQKTVRIASTPYMDLCVLPNLAERLTREAPSVRVQSLRLSSELVPSLWEEQGVHFALSASLKPSAQGLKVKRIGQDSYKVLAPRGHPFAKKRTLGVYLAARHLQIQIPGQNANLSASPIDLRLKKDRQERQIVWSTHDYLSAPAMITACNGLLTIPERLARSLADETQHVICELPWKQAPLRLAVVWHPKDQSDPFHCWIRNGLRL